jgi:hypothetical protein
MKYKALAFAIMSACVNAQSLQLGLAPSADTATSVVLADSNCFGTDGQLYTGVIKLVAIQRGKAIDQPKFIEVVAGSFRYPVKPTRWDVYYIAAYISGNRVVKFEKWEVPNVDYALRIDDVRRGRPDSVEFDPDLIIAQNAVSATIPESAVIGLSADLGIRPTMGPSFAPNRAVVVDGNGLLVGATGNPSACITVSGTSTPCLPIGAPAPTNGQGLIYSTAAGAWIPGSVATSTGGDLSGPIGASTVVGIQNHPVSMATPAAGQVLTWSAVPGQWVPSSPTTGEGFSLTQTSTATALINAECTVASPCNARFGHGVQQFTAPVSVTMASASGSGQMLFYLDSSGSVQIIDNLTNVSCSGNCTVTPSQSPSFPAGSIPTWSCSVVTGSWANCADLRAPLSTLNIIAGSGIFTIDTGSEIIVGVDSFSASQVSESESIIAVGPIANGTCTKTNDLSLPGASPGDPVVAGWPVSLPAGVIGHMQVSQPDTISSTLCNFSGKAVTLGSLSLHAQITSGPLSTDAAQPTSATVEVKAAAKDVKTRIAYCYGNPDCTQRSRRGYVLIGSCVDFCMITFNRVVGLFKYRIERSSAAGPWTYSDVWEEPKGHK